MRTWKRNLLIPIGLGLGCGPMMALGQSTITLEPIHDTYVTTEYPSSTFGDEATLFVHAGQNLKRTYLQFDLGGVSLDSVTELSLHMWYGQGSPGGSVLDLHHVASDAWDEATLTWNTRPDYTSPYLASVTTELGKAEVVWTLPRSLVQQDTDGKVSFLLKLNDEGLPDTATFFSKESSANLARPAQLYLAVPEPVHGVVATGLLLLAGIGIRRSQARAAGEGVSRRCG